MGVGMVWFVRPGDAQAAIESAQAAGFGAYVCGEVVEGSGKSIVTD